jgi:hypothetical protein
MGGSEGGRDGGRKSKSGKESVKEVRRDKAGQREASRHRKVTFAVSLAKSDSTVAFILEMMYNTLMEAHMYFIKG